MLASIPLPLITGLDLGSSRATVLGRVVAVAALAVVHVTRRRYEHAGGDAEPVGRVLFPALSPLVRRSGVC